MWDMNARRSLRGLLFCSMLGLASWSSFADSARVMVKLKADASLLRSSVVQAQSGDNTAQNHVMQRLGLRRGLEVQDGREVGNRLHVALAQGMSSEALAAVLAKDSDVVYAVPDRWRKPHTAVPNDPLYVAMGNIYVDTGQWYLHPYDSTIPAAINAEGAWGTATGLGQVVAVLDSGVRFDHPDLQNKLNSGYNMISYASVAGVSGGRSADASDLGDWVDSAGITAIHNEVGVNPECDVQATSSWHGTKVSGIIGAETNNSIGMASVAPDARILPVRILGKCGGWDSDILAGMRWAAGLAVSGATSTTTPARVINMSLGAQDSCSQAYKDVINEVTSAHVVIVASAGNDDGKAVSSPANCPGVIAVAGLRHAGTKVGYSSIGPEVTVSAPSGNCAGADSNDTTCHYAILTTTNTGATSPVAGPAGAGYTNSTTNISYGTSFAAPQVSGTVALMLQVRSSLTPAAVSSLLRKSARAFPTTGAATSSSVCHLPDGTQQLECYCTTLTCGAGMLDAAAAVQAASSDAVAVIAVSPAAPTPGVVTHLDGTQSMPSPGGSSIVSYQWTLLDGGGIVSSSAWNASSSTVPVTPSGTGSFHVQLTVTDNTAQTASIDQWVVVGAPTVTTTSSGGGGGGGEVGGLELAAMALCLALGTSWRRIKA
ncbi:MAG: PKD domain-containing protein [Burkholderiales bacterium]|nr:MAG: PKD domain-containing protein [Burkholderiales bacterium]